MALGDRNGSVRVWQVDKGERLGGDLPAHQGIGDLIFLRGKDRTLRRDTLRNGNDGVCGHGEQALVRMQREHDALAQLLRPGFDPSDSRIAVFHRKRECARHERRPHALVFARGHEAVANQPLGAAAERAEQRAHAHLAGRRRRDRLFAQLGPAGRDIPEGVCLHQFELYP